MLLCSNIIILLQVALSAKLLSSAEVPPFIPRDDLMDQMCMWAEIEAAGNGARNFGLPMKVERELRNIEGEERLWGFKVSIMRGGNHVTSISFAFDEGNSVKHQYLSKDKDGFPTPAGKASNIVGKLFEIYKVDDNPVTEDDKTVIKRLCVAAAQAMNKYYTFVSPCD